MQGAANILGVPAGGAARRGRRGGVLLFGALLVGLLPLLGRQRAAGRGGPLFVDDAPPARAPGTRPTVGAAAQLGQWWADLAHRDPAVREAARARLMGLGAKDLPGFRKWVADSRPMAPAQAAALRDIVTQAFLSGWDYDASTRDGFLGVRPGEVNLNAANPRPPVVPFGEPQLADPESVYGVIIIERMPGFCGARMLQDGDVILTLVERPQVQLRGPTEFSLAVRAMGAGQTIHFQVLRQGQVIRVPITLNARPDVAELGMDAQMKQLLNERDTAVKEYWEQEFAPLLKESVG